MVESSKLAGIVILSARRLELYQKLQQVLQTKNIKFDDKELLRAVNKIDTKFLTTRSEIQNKRISINNGLEHIIQENPWIVEMIFKNYLNIDGVDS